MAGGSRSTLATQIRMAASSHSLMPSLGSRCPPQPCSREFASFIFSFREVVSLGQMKQLVGPAAGQSPGRSRGRCCNGARVCPMAAGAGQGGDARLRHTGTSTCSLERRTGSPLAFSLPAQGPQQEHPGAVTELSHVPKAEGAQQPLCQPSCPAPAAGSRMGRQAQGQGTRQPSPGNAPLST